MIVVDASVAVKLYRDEAGSAAATELSARFAGSIYVPDLFAIEVAGTLVRDGNCTKTLIHLQVEKLASFSRLLFGPAMRQGRLSSHSLLNASELALRLDNPLRDCIYLALANELGCRLVTADARFAEKAQSAGSNVDMLGS